MAKRSADDLSIAELERLLLLKKREQRHGRWQRLQAEKRVLDGVGKAQIESGTIPEVIHLPARPQRRFQIPWNRMGNRFLLLVEVAAIIGLLVVLATLWRTNRELNQELSELQRQQSQALALPTATVAPVIEVVVLPGGHRPPVEGRPPEQGEAGDIPSHLLPAINAYVPPPIPTPGPEQARRLQIPAIGVDHPIVQGDDWEQLKKGVGQYVGSAVPGQTGNVVLSAHNDIYGEIFRYLDRLAPGNEVIISTERESYTYIIREIRVVEPTDVWVMQPTETAQATLISCYPYRIDTRRIVVFTDLVTEEG
jgi:sortase A